MRSLEAKSMCSCVSIIIKKRNQKENNKAIIVDIAHPGTTESMKRKVKRLRNIRTLREIIIIIIIIITIIIIIIIIIKLLLLNYYYQLRY